jgi:hypothetical protein
MHRSHLVLLILASSLAAWVTAYLSPSSSIRSFILPAPLYLTLALGAYLFIRLVVSVINFPTRPEEHQALVREVSEAVEALKKKGISLEAS